jgi:tetratricopeptide (TPR) repeat protein
VNSQAAAAQSRALADWAWTHMRTHPGRTLQLFGKKFLLLFNAHEWGIRDQFHFVSRFVPLLRWGLLPFWAIVPLGLVGALATLRAGRRVGLLHAVILVQIVSFVLIFVLARYRLVLVACLMPFAAWLILRCIEWVRDRQVRPLALALACVVLLFGVGSIRFADLPSGNGVADQWAFVAGVYREEGRLEQAVEAYESANRESWIDTRRSDARWDAWIGLVETQIALNRIAEAQENLQRLSSEIQRFYPALHPYPYEERIRELREQTGMLR